MLGTQGKQSEEMNERKFLLQLVKSGQDKTIRCDEKGQGSVAHGNGEIS